MRRVSHWMAMLGIIALVTCSPRPDVVAQQVPPGAAADAPAEPPPAEESPLLREPESAEALFDAVVLTTDLARLQLARRYLEGFVALEPDDATLLRLRDKHGPAAFMRLARVKALQPLSTQVLERMNAAFRRRATDPAQIDALISDLTAEPRQRELAILQLRTAGPVAIPQLLVRMQDPTLLAQRDLLTYTLTRLGTEVVPPLIAALDAPDPNLRAIVIEALGWIRDTSAIPHLWYHAYGPEQPSGVQSAARLALARLIYGEAGPVELEQLSSYGVAEELRQQAELCLRKERVWELDENGQVTVWSWVPERNTVASAQMTPEHATLYLGVRTSWQALALARERQDLQALHVALSLAYAAQPGAAAYDAPAPGGGATFDLALTSGRDVLNSALKLALDSRNRDAAVGALRGLARVETRSNLLGSDAEQSPILRALNAPDPAVQFAAAEAVLQIDPQQPFAGSSRIVEILSRAVLGGDAPRGLVIDPSSREAANAASLLRELGYEPEIAVTGKQGFRVASERGDVMLILINAATSQWPLSQTLANLRADARTARIPVAVFGPTSVRSNVSGLVERYQPATYVVESLRSEGLGFQLNPFLASTAQPDVSDEARRVRKERAASWLAFLADGQRSKIYDLAPAEDALFQAVNEPGPARDALFALAAIPSHSAQQRLQELVVNVGHDAKLRAQAARHLAGHIQQFDIGLTDGQVGEVKSAWESATDAELRTALASVVGTLQPDVRRVSELLLSRPRP